jgi:hypothetical protein
MDDRVLRLENGDRMIEQRVMLKLDCEVRCGAGVGGCCRLSCDTGIYL